MVERLVSRYKMLIDHITACNVLENLGYSLDCIDIGANCDISHQLYYSSIYSSFNLLGYIYRENGIYYSGNGDTNCVSPEQAAILLLPNKLVQSTILELKVEGCLI